MCGETAPLGLPQTFLSVSGGVNTFLQAPTKSLTNIVVSDAVEISRFGLSENTPFNNSCSIKPDTDS